jgi:hypothetical protein
MAPLQEWVDGTPGGELTLSKAIAENAHLETALADMPISVPKALQRQVSYYVRQNAEVASRSPAKSVKPAKPIGPVRKAVHFVAGLATAVAVLFAVGASVNYLLGSYSSIDTEQVAKDSIGWVAKLDEEKSWRRSLEGSYDLPNYLATDVQVTDVSEFDSEFGATSAYNLTMSNLRAVLFVFQSKKKFPHKYLGKSEDFSNESHFVGIANDGGTSYVLTVECTTPSGYGNFIGVDLRAPPLAYSSEPSGWDFSTISLASF